jgi:hypothetical protein
MTHGFYISASLAVSRYSRQAVFTSRVRLVPKKILVFSGRGFPGLKAKHQIDSDYWPRDCLLLPELD